MKKYLLLALVAAAAASCQKDDIEIAEQDIVSDYPAECNLITFKAGQEGAESTLQKTAYGKPGTVVWQGNEHFAVFPDGESQGADFAASSQSTGKSSCTMTGSCKTASCYRAVYPYSSAATFSEGKFSGLTIPTAQAVPGEGQFDPRADVMVAYTSSADMNFTFLHIGAKLGITVPNDGITAIEISCSANIAGKAEVSLGNEPAIESVSDASKTITLTCAQGKFTEGETYYACLLPTSQNETIKLKFIIGNNQYYEVLYRGSIGAMKRATRNMAAPPESAGHTLLRKSAVEAVIPMNGQIGRSAKTIVFDYRKNVPNEIINDSYLKQSTGSIDVYSPEDNVFYFVSENDIVLSEDMSELFYNCQSLTELVLNNFHTDYVTNMSGMFRECKMLANIDFSEFKTECVTDMSFMFSQLGLNAVEPVSLDLSSFDTKNVTDMSYMFAGFIPPLNPLSQSGQSYSNNIASITWPSDLSTAKVENMSNMFLGCQSETIDLAHFNTASVTNMSGMFTGCTKLVKIEIPGNWNTGNVTNMSGMFKHCYSLNDLDLKNLETGNVTDMSYMFEGRINISNTMTYYNDISYSNRIASITWPSDLSTAKVENMSGMFMGWQVTEIDLKKFNTASVTNMSQMFKGCTKLVKIAIPSNWNTKNVTNMSGMFQDCYILSDLDLANLNTANVTNMSNMFYGTGASASEKFTLDLSSFNTSKVTDMSCMFAARNRTKMQKFQIVFFSMLEEVDLSSFNTGNVQKFDYMFNSNANLETIYASSNFTFSNTATSDYMFSGCEQLTNYKSENEEDKTYAKIGDGGYFTAKP